MITKKVHLKVHLEKAQISKVLGEVGEVMISKKVHLLGAPKKA